MRFPETTDYEVLAREFRWDIPARFNIAVAACDRHATGARTLALIEAGDDGVSRRFSFDDIARLSRRFANALVAEGVKRGDRVAVYLSQSVELPVAHLAAFRAGFVSMPLFALFGEDAIEFRLRDSAAKVVVTDAAGLEKLMRVRDDLPDLRQVFVTDMDTPPRAKSFWRAIEEASDQFDNVDTSADDPAFISYTSGTTGNPKGALHAHRVLLGHLPCIHVVHDFFPRPGDMFWTPADWAWMGGLLNVLFPSWYHGVPVVAQRVRKFDPHAAMALMAEHGVRNVFLPPTVLKLMRQANVSNPGVKLRSIMCAGEAMGAELLDWVRATFGVAAHESYGQTECNLVVTNGTKVFPIKPGSMGRPTPGFDVRVVDDNGVEKPRGEVGIIAIRRPNPCMMLEYWNNPAATAKKYAGDFMMTGDLGRQDEDGYLWYVSREDDVITSSGYRIGPGEIEDTLLRHPAIALAAVAGVPDAIRTEVVKAWIVLREGFAPSDKLADDIREFVRTRLSAHEYPRYVDFVAKLPLTATGKVMRRELRATHREG